MNLNELISPSPATKQWLNIQAKSVKVVTLDADIANITDVVVDDLSANLLTLNNQVGVPNAPINATSFFSSGQGNLSQTDEFGATTTYATTAFVGDYLPRDGSLPMIGNLDMNGNSIVNIDELSTTGSVGIGKINPDTKLEVVGPMMSSDNGGLAAKQLLLQSGTGTISTIQSYQQSVGVRDLNILFKNLALGTSGSLSDGGAEGVIFIENASINPSSNPVSGSLLYSSSGDLNCRSSSGVITNISDAVISSGGPVVQGNFPSYADTTGLLVSDSGFSLQQAIDDTLGLANLVSLTQPIAPNGLRDLWQYGTGAVNGGSLVYLDNIDVLVAGGLAGSNNLDYSTDGGVTFNPCIFDIASTSTLLVGWNGTVATAINASFSYTSVDGINWFQGAALPTATYLSFNINWFSLVGLFVTGVNVSPTQQIMTSPDGINWTVQNSSTQALTIKSNNNICVSVGPVSPFIQSSVDGVNWIDTLSTVDNCRALCWSDSKSQFLAIGATTGEGFVSLDGISWSSVGIIFPDGFGPNDTLIYVDGPDLDFRYYASRNNPNGNYSLYSTPDARLPFLGTNLDGAVVNPLSYSLVFMQSRLSFAMGLNNSPFVAYSILRPTYLKPIDGSPFPVSQYSNNNTGAIITNTVTETSLVSTGVGSLIVPGNYLGIGSVTKIKFSIFLAGVVALSAVTIRLKGNGNQLWQSPVLAGPLTNVQLIGEIELTNIDNANPLIMAKFYQDGVVPVLIVTGTSLDYTVNDTFNLTAQFASADPGNQIQMNTINMELMKF